MREASWSLVPVAKCGLSRVGPCHHKSFSAPPPPRLVGLYGDGLWAMATPPMARSCVAMGAVRPRPIMRAMKARRSIRPSFTPSIILFSSVCGMVAPRLGPVRLQQAAGRGRGPPVSRQDGTPNALQVNFSRQAAKALSVRGLGREALRRTTHRQSGGKARSNAPWIAQNLFTRSGQGHVQRRRNIVRYRADIGGPGGPLVAV